jgi:hypothetical protein
MRIYTSVSAGRCAKAHEGSKSSSSSSRAPLALLARWLDVAIAAGAAAAALPQRDCTLLVSLAAAAGGSPLHLQVGGQQLDCPAANDCEVTTSAKTEQRVVCGLAVLHGAVAERGCGPARAAGWRQSFERRRRSWPSSKPRPAGPQVALLAAPQAAGAAPQPPGSLRRPCGNGASKGQRASTQVQNPFAACHVLPPCQHGCLE